MPCMLAARLPANSEQQQHAGLGLPSVLMPGMTGHIADRVPWILRLELLKPWHDCPAFAWRKHT